MENPNEETIEPGTIREGEYHPMADNAMAWYREFKLKDPHRYFVLREAIASTALSGNRCAEICNSTLTRLDEGRPISDRYLLGLCWYLKELVGEGK